MKKIILLFTLFTCAISFAQEKRLVKGFVQDTADKLGLPGASVIVETQSVSTTTNHEYWYND